MRRILAHQDNEISEDHIVYPEDGKCEPKRQVLVEPGHVVLDQDVRWTALNHCDLRSALSESWQHGNYRGSAPDNGNSLAFVIAIARPELRMKYLT